MGREVRRVALDFDWPRNKTWEGFLNPYYKFSSTCPKCGGSGYNPETKQIHDDWYDFGGTGRKWCYRITQDEVDALIEAGRLRNFTHTVVKGKGWVPKDPMLEVTAEMVNEWASRANLLGHDSINQWICVETRAKRLGVYGKCDHCVKDGTVWRSPEDKKNAEEWEEIPPPAGDGWQVWETVSEGSPITPVFPAAEGLAKWLVENGDPVHGKPSYESALAFVKAGWSPSMIMTDGTMQGAYEMHGKGGALAKEEPDE